MKKILVSLAIIAAFASCENRTQKDEAFDAANQKIVVDAVAVDNDDTETTSNAAMATLPK